MSTRKFDGWYNSIGSIIVAWPGCSERWWGIYFLQKLSPFWYRWADMMSVGWVQKFFKGDMTRGGMERTFNEWHV